MSITTTIIIALFVMLVIFGACIQNLWKKNRNLKQKLEGFQIETENLKQNIAYLMKHAEEITRIRNEAEKISEKINGAESDEEISDIVSAIISANNDRVQKH